AQRFRALSKGAQDLDMIILTGIRKSGEQDGAIGNQGFESVILDNGFAGAGKMRVEVAQHDLFQDVFKEIDLIVALDDLLNGAAELLILSGGKVPQRGQ